jgi:hypothetical protein
MSPFIRDGDVITLAPMISGKLGLGDVVAFTRPDTGHLVVHRITALKGNQAQIRGDSLSEKPDGIFPVNSLLGCVIRIERNQKRIWLGLGPERALIAWLSRMRLLTLLRNWIAPFRKHLNNKVDQS